MSIKIVTLEEADHTEKLCNKYGEFFHKKVGKANQDYVCDNSGVPIPKGTECAAIIVLPDASHPNCQWQINLLGDYVN